MKLKHTSLKVNQKILRYFEMVVRYIYFFSQKLIITRIQNYKSKFIKQLNTVYISKNCLFEMFTTGTGTQSYQKMYLLRISWIDWSGDR